MTYPEYDPYDGSEELSYENEWLGEDEQIVEGMECSMPFSNLNPEENIIVLKLSDAEFTEMFSALYWGAMFSYPEKYLQVVSYLLRAIHCPPVMADQECFEYPTYAGFMRYTPMNPFITPDEIPEGYATQPFLVNGENGNNIPNYEHWDVIVPSGAITLDIDWWTSISGQLPTIEVVVEGEGKALLKMLTFPSGGLAVITLDNPPDLLDIIAGIVTAGENIIDLNQDLVSLPPETAQELIFPVDVVGSGLHTIYIVFLPILDDSLIPVRFGGGFRGVQLCDFVESPEMGITNIRFEDCNLEIQQDGVWSIVPGWEDWLDCVPGGGGGGGGGGSLIRVSNFDPIIADTSTTNTTFTTVDTLFNITPVYSKMLVIVNNLTMLHSAAAGKAEARIVRSTTNIGTYAQVTSVEGTSGRQVSTSDLFESIPVGVNTSFQLQIRGTVAGTATLNDVTRINVTVIEFENAEDLYVQDIRISAGELQKKIGGVWINVTDSFAAIIAAVQATANNALSIANSAVSVNNTQNTQISAIVTVNNTQNTRLNALEADVNNLLTVDIPQINLTLGDHEARIAALEAVIGSDDLGGSWSHDFTWSATDPASVGWTVLDGTYVGSSPGIVSTAANPSIITINSPAFDNNQLTHIGIKIRHAGDNFLEISGTINGVTTGKLEHLATSPADRSTVLWMRVPNITTGGMNLALVGADGTQYYMAGIMILGRGFDPF